MSSRDVHSSSAHFLTTDSGKALRAFKVSFSYVTSFLRKSTGIYESFWQITRCPTQHVRYEELSNQTSGEAIVSDIKSTSVFYVSVLICEHSIPFWSPSVFLMGFYKKQTNLKKHRSDHFNVHLMKKQRFIAQYRGNVTYELFSFMNLLSAYMYNNL